MLDQDGILRINGRLKGVRALKIDQRCPIILPKNHPFSWLIMNYYHTIKLHHYGGQSELLGQLNQKFWLINGITQSKKFVNDCKTCRKREQRRIQPLMGDLPDDRVECTESAPIWTHTGVDLAGPYEVKMGRFKSPVKRYLCIFTCMNLRCCRLEILEDRSTDAFLQALTRFLSRNNRPIKIHMDQGTNFIRADVEVREMLANYDHNKIMCEFPDIEFDFIPVHSPWMGGCWESLIKQAKRALYYVIKSGQLTDHQLQTCFSIAESLLNNRPLTQSSTSPDDARPLTPNHFLLGTSTVDIAPDPEIGDWHYKKKWIECQEVMNNFWRRFITEYRPMLHKRQKWHSVGRNLKPDDVVLVLDKSERGWIYGKVTEVFPGKDGHVRKVKLTVMSKSMQQKSIERSVKELSYLLSYQPTEEKSDQVSD